MKVFNHLYDKVISVESLFQAWDQFKKGKRKKPDVAYFERHLEDNIFKLHEDLVNKTYTHSPYTDFYVKDPKVRHIYKAVVKDRIVHHAIFTALNLVFDPVFIADSYSCRKGYGTHKGFRKLVINARKLTKNYTRNCWALKCDIKKFFDSIDHRVLLSLLERKVADSDLMRLVTEVLYSYKTAVGKGIPIGNLTSQLFANIYLNELDQYVKQKLRVEYFLRYADDFILLSHKKNLLLELSGYIEKFVNKTLDLRLHDGKTLLRRFEWGIDFVGYVALPHYSVIRTKSKKRIFNKMRKRLEAFNAGAIDYWSLNQSFQSYLGALKHVNAFSIEGLLRSRLKQADIYHIDNAP
jgi:RNA-directed DNA polymerase